MKHTELSDDELNLISLAQEYSNDDKARGLLERLRWPDGAVCPRCKNDGKEKANCKIEGKPGSPTAARKGLYHCGACRKQFTVTVGTVFESSHVPIGKWLMAMFIICSSKKSISANQLHRMLKVQYKTAWFMAHRIRFAMGTDVPEPKLKGTVEADETFIGGKGDRLTMSARKTPVVALIERGGSMHARVVANVSQKNLGKAVSECVSSEASLHTDEHPGYVKSGKELKAHKTVNHSKEEYARHEPDGTVVHCNTCESFFSLLKRGVVGAWHSVSREHLPKYVSEFEFRWNTRKQTDGKRMENFVPMIEGKRLTYRKAV